MDDVKELLASFDVFVSSSRSEPFGLVIVEAMAGGVPVAASMSEGAQEIIEDGITGRLVPIRDPKALAKVINELLDDEPQRRRLIKNAQNAVYQRYSLERMVDETEQVYRDALANI